MPHPGERYPGSLVVHHFKTELLEQLQKFSKPRVGSSKGAAITRLESFIIAYEGVALLSVLVVALAKFSADVYMNERAREFCRCHELVEQYELQSRNSQTRLQHLQGSLNFWHNQKLRSEEKAERWKLQHQIDVLKQQLSGPLTHKLCHQHVQQRPAPIPQQPATISPEQQEAQQQQGLQPGPQDTWHEHSAGPAQQACASLLAVLPQPTCSDGSQSRGWRQRLVSWWQHGPRQMAAWLVQRSAGAVCMASAAASPAEVQGMHTASTWGSASSSPSGRCDAAGNALHEAIGSHANQATGMEAWWSLTATRPLIGTSSAASLQLPHGGGHGASPATYLDAQWHQQHPQASRTTIAGQHEAQQPLQDVQASGSGSGVQQPGEQWQQQAGEQQAGATGITAPPGSLAHSVLSSHSSGSAGHWDAWQATCQAQIHRLRIQYEEELVHLFESEMQWGRWRAYTGRSLGFETGWQLDRPAWLPRSSGSTNTTGSSSSSSSGGPWLGTLLRGWLQAPTHNGSNNSSSSSSNSSSSSSSAAWQAGCSCACSQQAYGSDSPIWGACEQAPQGMPAAGQEASSSAPAAAVQQPAGWWQAGRQLWSALQHPFSRAPLQYDADAAQRGAQQQQQQQQQQDGHRQQGHSPTAPGAADSDAASQGNQPVAAAAAGASALMRLGGSSTHAQHHASSAHAGSGGGMRVTVRWWKAEWAATHAEDCMVEATSTWDAVVNILVEDELTSPIRT